MPIPKYFSGQDLASAAEFDALEFANMHTAAPVPVAAPATPATPHTPGLVTAHPFGGGGFDIRSTAGSLIASGPSNGVRQVEGPANGRRLAAAWNLVDGVDTETLEWLGSGELAGIQNMSSKLADENLDLLAKLATITNERNALQARIGNLGTYDELSSRLDSANATVWNREKDRDAAYADLAAAKGQIAALIVERESLDAAIARQAAKLIIETARAEAAIRECDDVMAELLADAAQITTLEANAKAMRADIAASRNTIATLQELDRLHMRDPALAQHLAGAQESSTILALRNELYTLREEVAQTKADALGVAASILPIQPAGMTLRDHFAGQALAAYLSTRIPGQASIVDAAASYKMADIMLKVRA